MNIVLHSRSTIRDNFTFKLECLGYKLIDIRNHETMPMIYDWFYFEGIYIRICWHHYSFDAAIIKTEDIKQYFRIKNDIMKSLAECLGL